MKTLRFIRKYKLLHILFWIFWYLNFIGQLQAHRMDSTPLSAIYILPVLSLLCSAMLVYIVFYKLIPVFFYQRKYVLFLLSAVLFVLVFTLISVFISKGVCTFLYEMEFTWKIGIAFPTKLFDNIILVAGFTSVRIISDRVENDIKQKMLEKEKTVAELNFLKAQINPHFLFNTINSIYILMEENVSEARNALLKFSTILRYLLYESDTYKVVLSNEITLIEHYIELEKLRKGDHVQITFEVSPGVERNDFMIAPFLLITFVENAFKHISDSHEGGNFIHIRIDVDEKNFLFSCSNSYDSKVFPKQARGIGIVNARRRMELIYPQKYMMEAGGSDNVYHVSLQIKR